MQPTRNFQSTKQQKTKTMSYFILFIVVILFLVTLGPKLIVNSSQFITSIFEKKTLEDNRHTANLQAPPEILDLPDATHSAQLDITIQNVKASNVTILVNNTQQDDIYADNDPITASINLDKGDNTVQVISQNPDTLEEKKSIEYRVSRIDEKPQLDITSPTDNMLTGAQEINVTGKTGDNITIKVNEIPVVVSGDGSFQTTVKLTQNGENKITVTAENVARVITSKTITVRYEP